LLVKAGFVAIVDVGLYPIVIRTFSREMILTMWKWEMNVYNSIYERKIDIAIGKG
jgi:hypothetical protein